MTDYERQLMEQPANLDPIRGFKLPVVQGAMDEHQRKQDNTMRRREKHVVSHQRMIHTRENGPLMERDFLAVNEAGNLIATEFGHEAKKFDDVYEASALASRAERETGGNWQALPVSVLNAEARHQFSISRGIDSVVEQDVEFDEIAVQRAIEGDVNVRLSREYLREAYRRLREEELSDGEVGDTLGVDRRTVVRWNASGGPTTGRLGDPIASKRWTPPRTIRPKALGSRLRSKICSSQPRPPRTSAFREQRQPSAGGVSQ